MKKGNLMVLFQISVGRLITIYIANGIIFAVFIFLASKILKQGKKRLNIYFSLFYISVAIGIFFNFIYAPLTDPDLIIKLNFITNYFIVFGLIFLTVFIILYLKSEEVFTTGKQLAFIIIYGVLLFFMILIPDGVEISADTGWAPHWSWFLFIYVILLISIMSTVPSLFYSLKIYKKFEDERLKKKWKLFILGICELFAVLYGTFLTHALNIAIVRTIWSIGALILSLSGAYFIYDGVARKFKTT